MLINEYQPEQLRRFYRAVDLMMYVALALLIALLVILAS